MERPQHNYTNLTDFFTFLSTAIGYLEKASADDLGDFTSTGKTRNAGYNNYTVYWQWYKELGYGNLQGQYYCAAAVSTMCVNAFGLSKAKEILCGDLYVYCPTGYTQFKSKKRIYTSPQPGDVVFFYSTKNKRYTHTGWVVKVDSNGNGFTTWEANTSSGNNTVVRNGGATINKHYDSIDSNTMAFGRPNWSAVGISTGNSESSSTTALTTQSIGTGQSGLICVASSLNIRSYPGTGSVVGSIKKGEAAFPTEKAFIDGKPWYHISSGWISANYLTGWVQEKDHDNKWWYLLSGYTYYTDRIVTIGGSRYFFGSDGYLFVGDMSIKTDSNGAII